MVSLKAFLIVLALVLVAVSILFGSTAGTFKESEKASRGLGLACAAVLGSVAVGVAYLAGVL